MFEKNKFDFSKLPQQCEADFMPLSTFIHDELIKKNVVDKDCYNKSKKDILTKLIKDKQKSK